MLMLRFEIGNANIAFIAGDALNNVVVDNHKSKKSERKSE